MTGKRREGRFWDMLEGRQPPPPSAKLLGWTLLSIAPEDGEIQVSFDAKPEFLNPVGCIQGGMLCAMLDDTMGPAAMALLDGTGFPQTLELKTSFLRPAYTGRILAAAKVVHRGRDILFLTATLTDEHAQLLATATSTARIVGFPPA